MLATASSSPPVPDPPVLAAVTDLRLVLCDIDGCLNSGAIQPFDLCALSVIARQVAALRTCGVSVALITGRAVGYAQAVAQMLGITTMSVVENGTVLFDPGTATLHPLVTAPERADLEGFSRRLFDDPLWSGRLTLEPGKEVCISLTGPEIADQPPDRIRAIMAALMQRPGAEDLSWAHSSSAIDILPNGYDKATGAEALLQRLGLAWKQVAAVGDSNGDLPVLRRAHLAMCPQNADPAVQAATHVVSQQGFAAGTAELIALVLKDFQNEQ